MKINGIEIDITKLMSKQELLDYLSQNSGSDRDLSDVRERYFENYGDEMMWRYPLSEGCHMGSVIVAVKEGFLSLPYDIIEKEDYEIFELDDAVILDGETLNYLINEWKSYSDDLLGVMNDMCKHLKSEEARL